MENNALEMYNKMYENLEEALSSYWLMDMKQLKLNICDKLIEDMGDVDKFKIAHMIIEKDFKENVESKFNTIVYELLRRIEYSITNKFNLYSSGYKIEDRKTYIILENTKINLSDKTYEVVTNNMINIEDARMVLSIRDEFERISKYISNEVCKCKKIAENYRVYESTRYRTYDMLDRGLKIERLVMLYDMYSRSGDTIKNIQNLKDLIDFNKYGSYCRTLSSVIRMVLDNIDKCIQEIKQYELVTKNNNVLKLFATVNAQKEAELINNLKPKIIENKYHIKRLLFKMEISMCKNNRNLRNFASAKSIESTIELCKMLDRCGYECIDRYEISKAERLLKLNAV